MAASIQILVNGAAHRLDCDPDRSLLAVLREELGLTGAKDACGEGVCGACSVLLDGQLVRACVTAVATADGRAVTTAEGLATPAGLHPVQRAFVEGAALQCGYCTPGMIVAAAALLMAQPAADEAAIRAGLDGNICRCGAQAAILRSTRAVASAQGTASPSPRPPAADRIDAGFGLAGGRVPGVAPWDLVDPEARDWFTLLGDGIVGVVDPTPEDVGFRGLRPPGTWIHVGADGRATVFIGKVDIGQGTRTSLAQLAAAELGLPLEAVAMVMGDTDLCPYDAGTFGSRSTPEAGAVVRVAAATAREAIRRLASDRWEVAPADLLVENGLVATRDRARSAPLGEFLAGVRAIELGDRFAVGSLAPRIDGGAAGRAAPPPELVDAVTGRRTFPSDVRRAGMLHGFVLRPPQSGAIARSVETSRARALPDVTVVEERDGFAGVVAADPRTAARALAAIHATWDLPEAPSEAGLDDWLRSHPAPAEGWAGAVEHAVGDAEAALERSTVRLAAAYRIAYVAHVPAETRSAVAEWSDGRVTVWTGTQRPFGVRAELAGALGLDEAAVRVIVGPTGTGFGGKQDATIALEAARLARAAGAPVRVKWSREVEFTSGYLRPAALIDVQSGADDEGRLAAWSMTTYNAGPNAILPPYEVPNQAIRFQPTVSPLPQGAYRGLAATANTFARESHLDELARRLGVDPLEFRLAQLTDDRLAAVLSAAAARAGWSDAGRAEGRDDGYGVGIACGMEKGGRVATVAEVRATPGEPLEIARIVTAFECGAIVNPSGLAAQIEGATVMALGPTLFEAIHFEAGRITNPRLSAYPVPRFTTVPPIEVVLVDRPDLPSAGAGETPLIGVAPAVANAIADACGVRLRSLPLVPTGTLARG